jgi:hypothetical protein
MLEAVSFFLFFLSLCRTMIRMTTGVCSIIGRASRDMHGGSGTNLNARSLVLSCARVQPLDRPSSAVPGRRSSWTTRRASHRLPVRGRPRAPARRRATRAV